ncbi:MAG: hypothetical protein KDD85_07820 [Parvularculaceae bacterium]|nr:hypothetical protein [Parvularculaceae bacterium]
MNRRRFLIGAAAAASVRPQNDVSFFDGQTVLFAGVQYYLSDIIVPSPSPLSGDPDPGAQIAQAVLEDIRREGRLIGAGGARDRWARLTGPVRWRANDASAEGGRETSLQELLLERGAARVAPESDDFAFIDRCFAAEEKARGGKTGAWRDPDWRIRDAARAEPAFGFQIFAGAVMRAEERRGRIYFNFGEDYRSDFTASVRASNFRRWKKKFDPAALVGARIETRGLVERINGPSIELTHEKQLRML